MVKDPHLLFNKKAVVLFNLGGPGSLEGVEPFLFNLFNDKAIISLPNPFRYWLAKFVSKKRAPIAQKIYEEMGGKSPILPNTLLQADALQDLLSKNTDFVDKNIQYRVFVAMRYTEPRAKNALEQVKEWNPDEVILLPLYPQYSTTTTQSSFDEWDQECKLANFSKKTTKITNYETEKSFIKAQVDLIKPFLQDKCRILFSAHGLPQRVVDKGDPYQKQVIATAMAIMQDLPKDTDYAICYQSKVGRLKWLEPSTSTEIDRAIKDEVGVVVVPIAFVSEHSETLVELDMEYREYAEHKNILFYKRVPTVSVNSDFIKCLYTLVHK